MVLGEVYHCDGTLEELEKQLKHENKWVTLPMTLLRKFPARSVPLKKTSSEGQKWFGSGLCQLKAQITRETRRVAKESNKGEQADKTTLRILRQQFHKECLATKRSYQEELWNKLLWSSKQPNRKTFWQAVNELLFGKARHQNAGIDADAWKADIRTMYAKPGTDEVEDRHLSKAASWSAQNGQQVKLTNGDLVSPDGPESPTKKLLQNADPIVDIDQLEKILKKLKAEGAVDANGLQKCPFEMQCKLLGLLSSTSFQRPFSLQPISENGNPTSSNNYRLITLIDVEAKLFVSCLLQHLQAWVKEKNLIPEFKQTSEQAWDH
ncbi:hypothetical protein NDU88_001481 [Pleurodeles waltl]|uniref:Uncharacterized protein n=1 Tax=Pleurodeles waltl TaxID=8319 RepID=A0AAV7QA82_PLEWA|nr:hypothetical protein NDU88_001481 [Pleurodeles waltl]